MSARQAFIPRPSSCTPSSETHPHTTGICEDGERDMFVNGNGKARSIAALLGHKRGSGTDAGSQGTPQGPGLGRDNTSTHRRSFDGILRPEMTPMSIVPYPAMKQQAGTGGKQLTAGQTPRKPRGVSAFDFPRPLTPASTPRALQKGFRNFTEGQEENVPNGNAHSSSVAFMEPEGEVDLRTTSGAEIGGYMRVFEGSGNRNGAGPLSSLGHDVAVPTPVRATGVHGAGNTNCEAENMFARPSRSLDAMSEAEVGVEKTNNSQRGFGGTKRGMLEDGEGNGWYIDDDHHAHGLAKRMRQVQHDPDEYFPISSPHLPPTPAPPARSVGTLDPSLIASALFENVAEYITLEEIETDWKRWRECSTEEWLKGAEKLAEEYTDMLNMVKDHLTEKIMAYGNMISSVEERRKEVDNNIEIIHARGKIVRENISQLGTKK